MKHVVLLLRHTPLNHIKNLEAFRLGLGLTLGHNEVTVAMLDEGVFNAVSFHPEVVDRPEVAEFVSYYEAVGVRQLVERESLEKYGVTRLREDVQTVDRKEIIATLRTADVVIPF
ncbi:MAG: DsrE family protein [Nitrospirota bacterium]|nr:DsrE family protein [Nitrospirota bacterium]